jgi:hypothetical protein
MKQEPALVAGIITPPGVARRVHRAGFVPVGEIRHGVRGPAANARAAEGEEGAR